MVRTESQSIQPNQQEQEAPGVTLPRGAEEIQPSAPREALPGLQPVVAQLGCSQEEFFRVIGSLFHLYDQDNGSLLYYLVNAELTLEHAMHHQYDREQPDELLRRAFRDAGVVSEERAAAVDWKAVLQEAKDWIQLLEDAHKTSWEDRIRLQRLQEVEQHKGEGYF